MSDVTLLAVIRILAYGVTALYLLRLGRWWAWGAFTALTLTTYAYTFRNLNPLEVELMRTMVAGLLIYITVRRK